MRLDYCKYCQNAYVMPDYVAEVYTETGGNFVDIVINVRPFLIV